MSKFTDSFYGELEKLAKKSKKKHKSIWGKTPKPGTKESKDRWKSNRRWATAMGTMLSATFPDSHTLPTTLTALNANPGRRLRTAGGHLAGRTIGRVAGRAVGRVLDMRRAQLRGGATSSTSSVLGEYLGGAAGAGLGTYLGHGKYNKKIDKKNYRNSPFK